MIKHGACQKFQEDIDLKTTRVKILTYALVFIGSVMMLMGAAILTYLEDIK